MVLHLQAYYIQHPDDPAMPQILRAARACLDDNPTNGGLTRRGADECPAVTDALAEQAKALADAQKAAKPAPAPKP